MACSVITCTCLCFAFKHALRTRQIVRIEWQLPHDAWVLRKICFTHMDSMPQTDARTRMAEAP
jgi:hypothetical protein